MARLVCDLESYGATASCISAGGIVAFYQTRIAGQSISRDLGTRDLPRAIVLLTHRRDLHVLARVDPSCAPKVLACQTAFARGAARRR